MTPLKLRLLSLIIICATILIIVWISRNSLCELSVRRGNTEVVATLAYESRS
ncbi:Hok/Gef family protein [Erwiniaceae bacterium BAC15a-03b]|uniref:Hok/Gef family protein n=1 Tax=Winslowiella arboricola TaxID=2978220 RepID=A0A9J6PSK9_9GAMM|nr:Hok/Gef family protein [Winslowiella arboricola]MCU5771949.1 Hok/Gef family protein [Winslowiella arboricola]MCU5777031.1 Hok/Gef family protein [Winslowiella arboricola]